MHRLILIALLWTACLSIANAEESEHAFIDLQGSAQQELSASLSERFPDNHLGDVPQGEQKFDGVPFKIGPKCILLGSTQLMSRPAKAEIPVKRRFEKLHILQGTMFGAGGDEGSPLYVKDGALIGEYTVRYTDGSSEGIFIIYGEDVRDWWNWDKSKETKRGKVVWTGSNPTSKMYDIELRLYRSEWTNPKPDKEVKSIVVTSKMDSAGAPICVALTVE